MEDESRLEERVRLELQKPHPVGPHLQELRSKQSASEFYTREHVTRLLKHEARRPWGRERRQKKVLCSSVHPPGCKQCQTCHFCRQKTVEPKTYCKCSELRGRRLLAGRGRGYWCGPCLEMRIGENIDEVNQNPDWTCPICRDICNCSSVNCIRAKSGLDFTNQLWHEANSYGFKSVAHYLILTHVKEHGAAMPMVDLSGVRDRRPGNSDAAALPLIDGAAGKQRQRKGTGRAWRAQRIESVSVKTREQVTLEFQPPESLTTQDDTWREAMRRLRADFEVADGLEDDDVDASRLDRLCRAAAFGQGGIATTASVGRAGEAHAVSTHNNGRHQATVSSDAHRLFDPSASAGASDRGNTPAGADGSTGAAQHTTRSLPWGHPHAGPEALGSSVTAGPHPGLPALGAAGGSLDADGAEGIQGSAAHAGHGRSHMPTNGHQAHSPAGSARYEQVVADRMQVQLVAVHPQQAQGTTAADISMGPQQGAGALDDRVVAGTQLAAAPPPTASDKRSFFWELHDLVADWPLPEDDGEVMEDLDREVLRFLPCQSVAITKQTRKLSEEGLDSTPTMLTHSDLRACTQVLLRLPAILPGDQVEHQVVRRLFGYEPFLDFSGSDSVARAVLLDAAVNLVWQLKKAGKDFAEVAGYLMDFVEMLLAEAVTTRGLLAEAEAYCGLTSLEAVEVGHLSLPAVGLSQLPLADERIIDLQTLMEGNDKLVSLLLQHIFALCAHTNKAGMHVFLEDRLGHILEPRTPVTHDQRSLVLMVMMALMDDLVPGTDEEVSNTKRHAAEKVLTCVSEHMLRRIEVLVSVDTPARQKAAGELELLSPQQREQLAGLGGQSIMVLGRVFGLKVAYGFSTWADLEAYAISPCKRSAFWEHSRPVHRNFALKLLGFALQAMPSGPASRHEVRLALLRHWLRAVLERPNPNGATRLFVKMVTLQPWVEQTLRHQGGWAWETDRRATAFRCIMGGYSSDREHITAGLLQFLMNREAEVIAEGADMESSTAECCRWIATTTPVLISCIQALGAQELHKLLPSGGSRQGAARGSVLTGVLEHLVTWIPPSVAALNEITSPSQQSTAQDRSQLLQLARRRVQETVLSDLGGLLEILLDLGIPSCLQSPLRPSTDPMLRLLSAILRGTLELASGGLSPGPADEALLDQLAKAVSPDQGDDPQSTPFQRKAVLLHFVLSVYGTDFLESSRYPMTFCTNTAVNMLNFTAKLLDQTSMRGVDTVLQLVPTLVTPLITALAPNDFDNKGRSVMVTHAVFSLFRSTLKTHPGLVVPPPTGEEDPVDGVPYQGGPLQTAEKIAPQRFQAVMQIFLTILLEAVAGSVAAAVGAPQGQTTGSSQWHVRGDEIGPLTAQGAKAAQWELSKLLGQGRLLAESYREETIALKGMQRAPPRVRAEMCVPSGMELRAAKQGLGLLLEISSCQEAGAGWAHRALPFIRQCLVEHSPPHASIRLEYSRVLAQMTISVAEQYRLDSIAGAAASSVASRATLPDRFTHSGESRPACSASVSARPPVAGPPAIEDAAGLAMSQATQPYNPMVASQAPPASQTQAACVPLIAALQQGNRTPICIQGVVTKRTPEDEVGEWKSAAFLSLQLRDETAQATVMCVGDLATQIHRLLTPQQMKSNPALRMSAVKACKKSSVMRARKPGTASLNAAGSELLRQWFTQQHQR